MSEQRTCPLCDGARIVPIGDEMGDGGYQPCPRCRDELAAAYNAMREPVEPGNLPSAIYVLWSRLARAEVERTESGRVLTDADFERLATEAERDRYRDEAARLRSCIEAALERVELLDGGENDGYEAEAILRSALEGGGGR